MADRVDEILSFLKEIEKYKTIERGLIVPEVNRPESDAEHSWHLAMFLFLFKEELPSGLDTMKMFKMSLIHDLMEIYSGDVFAFDKEGQEGKGEREAQAAEKLYSQLPEDLSEELMSLYKEYQENETKEAKVVKSLDKLQPILQNIAADGKGWEEHEVTYSDVDEYKREYMQHDEFIKNLYDRIMESAVEKGYLSREE